MTGAGHLTAEERVFASMLADAVLEYARRNLKQLRRARRKHEPIPLPMAEEPTPTGCTWIGDRVILPGEPDRERELIRMITDKYGLVRRTRKTGGRREARIGTERG